MMLPSAFIKSKGAIKISSNTTLRKGVYRDRIAKEVCLSTGTVSNTIRHWEPVIGLPMPWISGILLLWLKIGTVAEVMCSRIQNSTFAEISWHRGKTMKLVI